MSAGIIQPADLFVLDWMTDPEQAVAFARERGITEPRSVEVSAWCAELHEQLRLIAEQRQMPLLLMGGHAASLRMEAAKQRGSRDNDYLTTATEQDVVGLMDALQERFAPHFAEPLFRHRRLTGGEDAEPLPLATFVVDVPALLDPNETVIAVKLEFHLETDKTLFPSGEKVEGSLYGLAESITAQLPLLPYQIALKLLTLHEAPVGLMPKYEHSFPRQMWDVDELTAQMQNRTEFETLADYAERRYIKEERFRARQPDPTGPWPGIESRLSGWEPLTDGQWRAIERFQSSQLTRASRRVREHWAARVARVRLLCRLLKTRDYDSWMRVLELELRIPERVPPSQLKVMRAQVASVTGSIPSALGQYPRRGYWEHLATTEDVPLALSAFADAIP